ncbi:hypothetical protein [Streptomyces shenzhenensis]|uniref:hypothetical protein n=1 Tax=Streptomyces shenzhenensis TaxID=943815 RepID=UPI0036CE14E4
MTSISGSAGSEVTLRALGACCAVGNAVLHGLLVPDHLEEKFYIGVLFALGSAVMLGVAAALVTLRRPTVAWLAGALVSFGMIVGFLLSRTVGLPAGYYEADWDPPYGLLSLIVEGVFILACLAWLGAPRPVAQEVPGPAHVDRGPVRGGLRRAPDRRGGVR